MTTFKGIGPETNEKSAVPTFISGPGETPSALLPPVLVTFILIVIACPILAWDGFIKISWNRDGFGFASMQLLPQHDISKLASEPLVPVAIIHDGPAAPGPA